MHRFFIENTVEINSELDLPNEIAKQIMRVLHLKSEDEIILLDNKGNEYRAKLSISSIECKAFILEQRPCEGEPNTQVTLILGLTQREKFELILQKCTEIGVSNFIPVVTSRSLVQKNTDALEKYPRWRKIITEAAEQSHRGKIPELFPSAHLRETLAQFSESKALKLTLWEEENTINIKQTLQAHQGTHIILLIGPEGGLSENEVNLAAQYGFISVSLGKRILRMESAAMVASALVLYEKE